MRMAIDPTIGERAAAALDADWMKTGFPAVHDTVTHTHAAIKDRLTSGGYGKNWQALLDGALSDIGLHHRLGRSAGSQQHDVRRSPKRAQRGREP